MKTLITPTRLALGAAALLALLVVPVAVAGTEGDPQASASGVQQKIKKLKKQVKKANRAIAALQQQVGALQGEQGGSRPPTGPAGGDLTGTFPNPQIGANTVGTAELQTDSVTEPKIAADAVGTGELQGDSVTEPKIAADAVGTGELQGDSVTGPKIATRAVDTPDLEFGSVMEDQLADDSVGSFALIDIMMFQRSVQVLAGQEGVVSQNCPSGALISGGAAFQFRSGALSASFPISSGEWRAEGRNNGMAEQTLTVWVLCLPSEP
jgi:hypothetical protein